MTNNEVLKADMLDILFEHRNKLYGAYALRKHYNERLGKALAISMSFVIMSILLLLYTRGSAENKPILSIGPPVKLSPVDVLEEKKKPPEQRQPERDLKRINSVDNIVIADVTDVNPQSDISDAAISNSNADGHPPADPNTVINDPQPQTTNLKPQTQPDPEPLPSYAPSFPGGSSAWLNYLRKFLQTPDDLEAGQRIEVQVKFWVETDGSVSRFEIIKSGGNEFDKEVLRVMKKMPKWEAAMQNGQKIAVSFTQPVIFLGVEE